MTPGDDGARLDRLLGAVRPGRRTRIADVGARNINANPYRPLLARGAAEVWAFDPAEDAVDGLRARGEAHVTVLPHAIGSGAPAEFRMCHSAGFSSLYEPDQATLDYLGQWWRATRIVERIPLQTRRLDDIAGMPRIDLLKIDIQGGEYDVFRGATDRLSEAVAIVTEVGFLPLYKDQPTLADQMAELTRQGFILHKFLFAKSVFLPGRRARALQPRRHRSQLIDGDAVFIRDMRAPDRLSDTQLGQMAILADSVFHSFDLALRCLDLLEDRGTVDPQAADGYAAMLPHRMEPAGQGA